MAIEIDSAFELSDHKKASSLLLSMQRSLRMLTDVPDYADRKARVAVLENKLEALLSPKLVSALATHSLGMMTQDSFTGWLICQMLRGSCWCCSET